MSLKIDKKLIFLLLYNINNLYIGRNITGRRNVECDFPE